MNQPKIIFIGTSQFAVPILEKLFSRNYQIIAIITAPDRPAGRRQELTPPPIKEAALNYNLPILQPERIEQIQNKISEMSPDLIVLAAYGRIIPKGVLNIPRLGCLNFHPSLLPKYRGPSPIQTAILNDDKITGVTIILMDEKIDHGPIIAQKELSINPRETSRSLEEKLSHSAANLLIEILPQYLEGKIKPEAQDESKASYTKIINREDGRINWQESAQTIDRKIRAFYPWPGAWTYFGQQRVKIIKAKAVDQAQPAALSTGKGFLFLEIVQPAGKKTMTGQEFFRGRQK